VIGLGAGHIVGDIVSLPVMRRIGKFSTRETSSRHSHLDLEFAPAREIGARVKRALEDPTNEQWLSPISGWELVILVEKKRVLLTVSVDEWVAQSMAIAPLKEAPLTTEVALATSKRACPTEIRLTPPPKHI
jgi:hypothetical protein